MSTPLLSCKKINVSFDERKFEGVSHPDFLLHGDAIRQYLGIWKIIGNFVITLGAKRVLEFGTREGYSTRLFSKLLRATEGHLWTVDKDDHQIPLEEVKEMDNVTFLKTNIKDLRISTGDSDRFSFEGLVVKEPLDILYIDDWQSILLHRYR